MSRVLCTFPGKCGDILWALPTVRAVAETYGHHVDLAVMPEFQSVISLIDMGTVDYIGRVCTIPSWVNQPPAEWQPPGEGTWGPYDRVYHLGYRGWPQQPLPVETYQTLHQYEPPGGRLWADLDLHRPWITWPMTQGPDSPQLVVGFTEDWFELKVGLITLLDRVGDQQHLVKKGKLLTPPGSRWEKEAGVTPTVWSEAATYLNSAKVILADCSALHVLTLAMGKSVLVFEPMEARWNPIFYPYGMGPGRVTVIKGNDGRPTFDARHTADALRAALLASRPEQV